MLKRALIFAAFVVTMFLLPLLAGAAVDETSPGLLAAPLWGFAGLVIAGLALGGRRANSSLG